MPALIFSTDISGEQLAEQLAVAYIHKQAALPSLPPAAQLALAGAGVGGLLGAGTSLTQDPEDRQTGRSALRGAIAGASLGGGGALLAQNLQGNNAAAATPKLPANAFTRGDKNYMLDKNLPAETAQQILDTAQKADAGSWAYRGLTGLGDSVYNTLTSPEGGAAAATAGTGVALKGAVTNNRGYSWLKNIISPFNQNTGIENIQDPKIVQKGILDVFKNNPEGFFKNHVSPTAQNPDLVARLYAYRARRAESDPAVLKHFMNNKMPGTSNDLPHGMLNQIKEKGWRQHLGLKATDSLPGARRSLLGTLSKGMFSPNVATGSTRSLIGRAGKWGVPIAGAATLANYLRGVSEQSSASQQLEQLLQQHAKPVN